MRACATMPGLHTFVDLVRRRPRLPADVASHRAAPTHARRRARVDGRRQQLDAMMSGGIPAGESALFVGPVGLRQVALRAALHRGRSRGGRAGHHRRLRGAPGGVPRARERVRARARVVHRARARRDPVPPVARSDDRRGARRGARSPSSARRRDGWPSTRCPAFELALAPSYRDDFRESLFRTTTALTGLGVTVLMTVDIVQSFTELGLSPHITEFLSDVLVLQRYVELEGKLEKALAVVKMRNSRHDTSIRRYAIEPSGVVVGGPVQGYDGVLTGLPLAPPLPRRPAARRTAPAQAENSGTREGAQEPVGRRGGRAASPARILVVDDDESSRRALEELLRARGFDDATAPDGEVGARRGATRAARRRPHGPADASAHGRRRAVPATSRGRPRSAGHRHDGLLRHGRGDRVLASGAEDYLLKPLNHDASVDSGAPSTRRRATARAEHEQTRSLSHAQRAARDEQHPRARARGSRGAAARRSSMRCSRT